MSFEAGNEAATLSSARAVAERRVVGRVRKGLWASRLATLASVAAFFGAAAEKDGDAYKAWPVFLPAAAAIAYRSRTDRACRGMVRDYRRQFSRNYNEPIELMAVRPSRPSFEIVGTNNGSQNEARPNLRLVPEAQPLPRVTTSAGDVITLHGVGELGSFFAGVATAIALHKHAIPVGWNTGKEAGALAFSYGVALMPHIADRGISHTARPYLDHLAETHQRTLASVPPEP